MLRSHITLHIAIVAAVAILWPSVMFGKRHSPSVCDEVKNIAFPTQDKPSKQVEKGLEGCNSVDLYYGIGQESDPKRARLCAFVERAHGDTGVLTGSRMLMVIYANREGATRNFFDLALHLACIDTAHAPAEGESRINTLAARRANPTRYTEDFNYCDNITSGFMEGACEDIGHRKLLLRLSRQTDSIAVDWSPEATRALERLRRSAKDYFETYSINEIDISGTSRAAISMDAEARMQRRFLRDLKRFEAGKLPQGDMLTAQRADKKLNAIYQRIMHTKASPPPPDGAVVPEGVQKTQRIWLRYRDAWIAFGQQRYPGTSAAAWNTWITQERVRLLKEAASQIE